jgi:hypothetical protein
LPEFPENRLDDLFEWLVVDVVTYAHLDPVDFVSGDDHGDLSWVTSYVAVDARNHGQPILRDPLDRLLVGHVVHQQDDVHLRNRLPQVRHAAVRVHQLRVHVALAEAHVRW